MKKRIIGIDVARAFAVIGMIIVNFKVVFGEHGDGWVKSLANLFDGKAAATFVVLAGVGLALMTNGAIRDNDERKLNTSRKRISKRAIFLFVVGLSYIAIWPADILHFYGVYMVFAIVLLRRSAKVIISIAIMLILAFPLLMMIFNYETGWDFTTLAYTDFWSVDGFFRNLLFNGFHPVIPWAAFLLFGFWLGKQDLSNQQFVQTTLMISSVVFISVQLLSKGLIAFVSEGDQQAVIELTEIIGTNPMPPLPLYMINGVAIAFVVITACILIAKRFEETFAIDALVKTGQLALTFYVAHVIIGMGLIEVVAPSKMGGASITFSVGYALVFSICCVAFAVIWRKYKAAGPLEWVMRKLTD